ncbi:MAG: class I SAM-dependent methyltransferase [bacterium]
MKNEKVFSNGGFYQVVLTSNALLHTEAAKIGTNIVSKWLRTQHNSEPVRILDLACGGTPYTVLQIINGNDDYKFEYCGIDINPDQVAKASQTLECLKNVIRFEVLEGDIWNISALNLDRKFDLIFVGMNLHHGSSSQIKDLFIRMIPHFAASGLFLNHDLYKPEICSTVLTNKLSDSDWRKIFIDEQKAYLRQYNVDEKGLAENAVHIMKYDHPLSLTEAVALIANAGFTVKTHQMTAFNHLLGKYFAVIEAKLNS